MKSVITVLAFLGYSFALVAQDISGTYAIKNVETGIFLRIKDANKKDGTPIVAYSPVNWKCVTWEFQKKQSNAYQLKNLYSDKTFHPAGPAADGMYLSEIPLSGSDAGQEFEFIPVAKNIYFIKLKNTALYITPADVKGEINNPVVLKKKIGGKIQQWTLIEQHPQI